MKKIFLALAAAAALFVGCTKELEQRVGDLETSVEQLKSDLEALEKAVEKKLVVNKMETVENGYKLTFSDGTTVTLQNGAKGDKGDKGDTGATGAAGSQGSQGPQGPQGEKGEDGDAFFESVNLSEDGCYLVITLVADENGEKKVYTIPMSAFNLVFEAVDFVAKVGEEVKVPYTVAGAKESDNVVVRLLAVNNCTAVVDAEAKTINVTLAEGDAYVDVYAINNATGEVKAKTLTFYGCQVSVADTKFYVSPVGGRVEVPVTTDVEYEVEVSDSWLEFRSIQTPTKALRDEVVVLVAQDENTSANDLTATVTLKTNGKVVAQFEVVQKNYYPAWIADENETPVVWTESFKISRYSDMSGAESKKGTFTFELSDDPAKGAFKVVNMFYADLYYNNSQMVQNQGGVYYADVEGNVLTIHKAGSVMSYGFSNDFEVAYNAGDNSFSLETIKTYNYSNNRDAYIAEYKAVVKVNTPAGGDSDPIAGTWDITCDLGTAQGSPYTATTGTMEISGSNGSYVIETIAGETYNINATFDGNTLTSEEKNGATLVFTYDASAKTLTQSGEFVTWELKAVKNIVATKQGASEGGEEGGEDHSALYGEYTENFDDSNYLGYPTKGTLKVEASDDTAHDIKMTFFGGTNVAFTVYADVDGSTITTVNPGTYSGMGQLHESTLTVSGNTISGTLNFDYPTIPDYSATKAGGSEEEGGETTDEPTFLVGTWDQTVTGMTWPAPSATMTIAVSGNTVTLTDFIAPGTVAVGTYANNTITIAAGTAIGGGNSAAGYLDNELELVVDVDNNTISFPYQFTIGAGYIFIANYSATKQAAVSSGITANDLIGSWQETFEIYGYGTYTDSAMTISATDDSSKGQLKVRMLIDEMYQEELVCYANLSSDGTKLTVLSNGVSVDTGVNTFSTNIELTVSEDGKTLSFVGPYVTYYQYTYQNFTATKLN